MGNRPAYKVVEERERAKRDRDYICAYCLVDAHEKCTRGQGCKCECRTGKPLVVRSPAAHADQAKTAKLAPAAVRAAVDEMRTDTPTFPCPESLCPARFGTEHGAQVRFARMHGPKRVGGTKPKPTLAGAGVAATVRHDAPHAIEPTDADDLLKSLTSPQISQRARDVSEVLGFLDRRSPSDVLSDAVDRWAEQIMAEREDVWTIVSVVTKRRIVEGAK